jgi:hypothetical protein
VGWWRDVDVGWWRDIDVGWWRDIDVGWWEAVQMEEGYLEFLEVSVRGGPIRK